MGKAATIYDVVRESGLSKGTVYRVVYGKGPVSAESRRKVNEAIEKLHYIPNVFATSLAVRKTRRIVCITPEFSEGSYWEEIHKGFVKASKASGDVEVNLDCLEYSETDPDSFSRACDMALRMNPDGMVLGLQFENLARGFVLKLQQRGIPYVLIDNLFEDAGRLAYYGVDFFKSGNLAAHLLSDGAPVRSCLLVRLRRDREGFSDPTRLRREGFISYLRDNYPSCKVYTLMLDASDSSGREEALDAFFAENPGVTHAAVMNSRTYLLTDYLSAHPVPGLRVVGFDDISRNLNALRDGHLTFLLSHHLDQQASCCIKSLSAFLLRGERPSVRDNYLHMDILTQLNSENY